MIEYFQSCFSDPLAILGLIAGILVLVSMCFNGKSNSSYVALRLINTVGSILYIIYSVLIGPTGLGMTILNVSVVIINIYYLIKHMRGKHK